jgi:hypothetical protein
MRMGCPRSLNVESYKFFTVTSMAAPGRLNVATTEGTNDLFKLENSLLAKQTYLCRYPAIMTTCLYS